MITSLQSARGARLGRLQLETPSSDGGRTPFYTPRCIEAAIPSSPASSVLTAWLAPPNPFGTTDVHEECQSGGRSETAPSSNSTPLVIAMFFISGVPRTAQ